MSSQPLSENTLPEQTVVRPRAESWAQAQRWLPLIATIAIVGWVYSSTLAHLSERWSAEPEYSHGYFVPLMSAFFLWIRRHFILDQEAKGSYWGLALLVIGISLNWASTYYYYTLLGAISLLPTLAGLAVLAFGLSGLKWAGPSIAFLFFMIPLPGAFSGMLAHPLQRLATESSTFLLQLLGIAAVADGNIILLSDGSIGVVEACSGLRMLILFFAISAAVAMIVKRPVWERLLILVSAAPIALGANILRITATGIIHEMFGAAVADGFFHNVGGLIMGPVALGILFLELKFLSRAFLPTVSGPLTLATDGGSR